jgi:acyl-homoserine lactone acylase PvdQ
LAHDPYLPAFKALIPGLINAYDITPKPNREMASAIDELRKWDFTTSRESIAMTLAHYYGTLCFQKAVRPEELNAMELLIFWGGISPDTEKLTLFTESLLKLKNDFGTWQMPWGEVNRYQRLNGAIRQPFDDSKPSLPIGYASGTWGALAAYGARYHNNTKKLYGTRGNSFVAVVEFGDKVKAKSILAGGQNGDPSSPHFNDQIEGYANAQFKEVAFYKEEVLKRAKKTYKPGE